RGPGEAAAAGGGGARPAEAAAGTRTAGTAILARARFADRERPAVEHLPVELLDRLFGVAAVLELDEREAARPSRFTVDRQDDLSRRRHGAEIRSQVGFRGAVSEITDEQANGQSHVSLQGEWGQ